MSTATDQDREHHGRMAVWGVASRLARREVRRRPGRTALVVALVAIPVLAMTIGSIAYRTTRDTPAAMFERNYGQADAATMQASLSSPGVLDAELARLPDGSRTVLVHEVWGTAATTDGHERFVQLTDVPATDPLTRGMVDIVRGRVPAGPGEVAVDTTLAREFGVDVGDVLALARPALSARVVGIVRDAGHWSTPQLLAPGFDIGSLRPEVVNVFALVDVPDGTDLAAPSSHLMTPDRPLDRFDGARGDQLAWGWIGGALALAVMGIVIAAAFASSARRQLVTLGQLAANGADRSVLRRTLALQGAWSGLLGAAVGIAAGVVVVAAQRPLLDRLNGHRTGGLVVAPVDLAVIALTGVLAATVAAAVPSRTVTRVPVLGALAGRVPLGRIPRRLVPAGLVTAAGGVGLVALGAIVGRDGQDGGSGNLAAALVVGGGVAVLAGTCALSPAIVAVFGPVAERTSGTVRLAARSLARTRTRSAAVVSAVAATGALAVGVATLVGADQHESGDWGLARNLAIVATFADQSLEFGPPTVVDGVAYGENPPEQSFPAPPADTRDRIERALPGADVVQLRAATYDPAARPLTDDRSPVETEISWPGAVFQVADDALLDAIALDPLDHRALADVGVLTGDAWFVDEPGEVRRVVARSEDGPIEFDVATSVDAARLERLGTSALVTPERAGELGLTISDSGLLVIAPDDLTAEQREQLGRGFGHVDDTFAPVADDRSTTTYVMTGAVPPTGLARPVVDAIIVAAALLLVAAVVGVALSLSAAESRDQRDVLIAIGAAPRSMRRISALEAVMLAAVGGVLALPTGFLPIAAVLAQSSSPDQAIPFPWLVAAGCAVVIPLAVYGVTIAGATVTQGRRPRLAAD